MNTLIYTIAFDALGESHHQIMAKVLITSILRNGFRGDVLVFTNSKYRLFETRRPRLREVSLDSGSNNEAISTFAKTFKYEAPAHINVGKYEKIMFVDSDCIFVRDPSSLLAQECDLMYSLESWSVITDSWHNGYLTDQEMSSLKLPGINSGVWWVRGEHYIALMKEWKTVNRSAERRKQASTDQSAWVRVLLDTQLRALPFSPAVVRYPFYERMTLTEMDHAALLHFAYVGERCDKVAHMIGFFTRAYNTQVAAAMLDWATGC